MIREIQSSNFVEGRAGWRIDKDGKVEINGAMIRDGVARGPGPKHREVAQLARATPHTGQVGGSSPLFSTKSCVQ